jgi:hypothetical protein
MCFKGSIYRKLRITFIMVWIGIFFFLLAVAEIYQSVQSVDLPMPIYLILGAALAILSNYDRKGLPWHNQIEKVTLQEIKDAPVLLQPRDELLALPPADVNKNQSSKPPGDPR